jgi:hypothetical protein
MSREKGGMPVAAGGGGPATTAQITTTSTNDAATLRRRREGGGSVAPARTVHVRVARPLPRPNAPLDLDPRRPPRRRLLATHQLSTRRSWPIRASTPRSCPPRMMRWMIKSAPTRRRSWKIGSIVSSGSIILRRYLLLTKTSSSTGDRCRLAVRNLSRSCSAEVRPCPSSRHGRRFDPLSFDPYAGSSRVREPARARGRQRWSSPVLHRRGVSSGFTR